MLAQFIQAVAFAAEKHKNQRRKNADASPYINHPIELADLLANDGGIVNTDVLCAAVLHDTIEDTDTTAEELREIFGPRITGIVMEVTDDKSLPRDVRKQLQVEHAPGSSHEAKLVKLADKICNLRDMIDKPPAGWSVQRRLDYFEWAARVISGIRGTNSKLEKIFDALVAQGELLRNGNVPQDES